LVTEVLLKDVFMKINNKRTKYVYVISFGTILAISAMIYIIPYILKIKMIHDFQNMNKIINNKIEHYPEIQLRFELKRTPKIHFGWSLYQTKQMFITDEILMNLLPILNELEIPPPDNVSSNNSLYISLENSKISDSSFDLFSQIKNLGRLNISNCDITDNAFKNTNQIGTLYSLDISGTHTTKEILPCLMKLYPQLKFLTVSWNDITNNELITIKKQYPNLLIFNYFSPLNISHKNLDSNAAQNEQN
jgi:hypothetical protein